MSDAPSTPPKRARRLVPAAVGGAALAAAAGAYVGVAIHGKDTVASGTVVAGQHLGGMTKSEAAERLRGIAHPEAGKNAVVTVTGSRFTVSPGRAYHVDVDRTLKGRVGFSLSPASVWRHAVGGGAVTPSYRLDRAELRNRVKDAANAAIPGAPRQGRVMFVRGKVVTAAGRPGRSVDADRLAARIAQDWPHRLTYSAPLVAVQPDATPAALRAFADGDARTAMSKPLVLTAGGHRLTMSPEDVSNVISSTTDSRTPRIVVDSRALERFILSRTSDFIEAPRDAKVVWTQGKPTVAPSVDGKKLDTDAVAASVAKALVTDHVAQVHTMVDRAAVTKDDIEVAKLPRTSIAHFVSPFPLGASQNARIHNITTAVARLNGVVVRPGQKFSLLRTLGWQLTKERGYVAAGTLQNGLHVDGMGGGVSQVSTTMYNTAFFSGVRLGEHTPHAVWISRYPMGREATLWSPSIDNTWTNDTGHPILIKASAAGGQVAMDFYGTKKYDVRTRTSPRYHLVAPKHRTVRGVHGCENSLGSGTPGFSVDVWRTLTAGGKTVRTEKVHTTYAPDDVVTCG